MTVRTRFAPSPTGYLHIGGVRTALFNWLYARKHNGQFILRIDDTDQERNVMEALAPILHGFRWLGLNWDEGPGVGGPYEPYFQSQRNERYQAAVDQLLASGHAYRDYATKEELDAEREQAQAEKRPFLYSRRWMGDTAEKCFEFEGEGREAVVRLKMPREGKLVINDHVRGAVEFEWARETDHVIQRANGTFLYHLANVVDDHDFQISHVIRAEEHLSNTPRQIFLIDALGYDRPEYAHLPFVAEPGSKSKLSKRKIPKYLKNQSFAKLYQHGKAIADALGLETNEDTFNPVIVDFYEQVGYLPEALLNYLALIGWSLDDHTEDIPLDVMIESFSLERVVKGSASFDPDKLWAFQDRWMAKLSDQEKMERMLPFLRQAGLIDDPNDESLQQKLLHIVRISGDRLKVFGDIIDYAKFFFVTDDALSYSEKDFQKRVVGADAIERLKGFREQLANLPEFDKPSLEKALHDFVEAQGIKSGDLIHPVRVATTGVPKGPGLFDCLEILGRDSVLARISRAVELAESQLNRSA